MIRSHRFVGAGTQRVALHRALTSRLVLRAVFARGGLIIDELLWLPQLTSGVDAARTRWMIVLRGPVWMVSSSREVLLQAGEWVLLPEVGQAASRILSDGVVLELDWEAAPKPCFQQGRTRRLELLSTIADALTTDSLALPTLLLNALSALRADGVPVPEWSLEELLEPQPARLATLMQRFDNAFSHLNTQPMTVDLEDEMGITRRTVHRQTVEYAQRFREFGLGGSDWRSLVGLWRMRSALVLLTLPSVSLESVARASGFQSTHAVCHAFSRRGLPSPLKIRELSLREPGAR